MFRSKKGRVSIRTCTFFASQKGRVVIGKKGGFRSENLSCFDHTKGVLRPTNLLFYATETARVAKQKIKSKKLGYLHRCKNML